jgi:hypothetical protein
VRGGNPVEHPGLAKKGSARILTATGQHGCSPGIRRIKGKASASLTCA